MSGSYAIVIYRCLVEGKPTSSVDIQVRWFESSEPKLIWEQIKAEAPRQYKNAEDQWVVWDLVQVAAIEHVQARAKDGDEVVGFIANMDEISQWIND